MKVYLVLTICTLLGVQSQRANLQSPKTKDLLFISGAPIKLDGGCSYYSSTTTPFNSKNVQLIIDSHHRAFIEYKPYKYAFFNRIKRVEKSNGYEDYFKGELKGSFVLTINSIIKFNDYSTFRKGICKLNYPGLTNIIYLHGIVEDNDSYNKTFISR